MKAYQNKKKLKRWTNFKFSNLYRLSFSILIGFRYLRYLQGHNGLEKQEANQIRERYVMTQSDYKRLRFLDQMCWYCPRQTRQKDTIIYIL